MTDPISDYLTRIRNAYRANHKVVEIPASKMKKELTSWSKSRQRTSFNPCSNGMKKELIELVRSQVAKSF